MSQFTLSTLSTTTQLTSGIFSPSTAAEMLKAERRCSARPIVGQWADGARKPKLIQNYQFESRDGVWANEGFQRERRK